MAKKKRISETKAGYQRILAEYLKRRDKVRSKFISTDGRLLWKSELYARDYNRKVWKIRRMIKVCQTAIRRYEQESKNILEVSKLLKRYIGVAVYHCGNNGTETYRNARNIFYKHCIESEQLSSKIIGEFVGVKGHSVVGARMRFTRSFATKKGNKELWYSWKQYLNNLKTDK